MERQNHAIQNNYDLIGLTTGPKDPIQQGFVGANDLQYVKIVL